MFTTRMLVVDDEEVITTALRAYFSVCGFDVDVAAEREEALALLALREYDAVIADLRLTGSGGEEGLDVVRSARVRNSDAAVVLLTAFGTPSLESRATRVGADVLLHKEQPLAEIARTVTNLVEERRYQH